MPKRERILWLGVLSVWFLESMAISSQVDKLAWMLWVLTLCQAAVLVRPRAGWRFVFRPRAGLPARSAFAPSRENSLSENHLRQRSEVGSQRSEVRNQTSDRRPDVATPAIPAGPDRSPIADGHHVPMVGSRRFALLAAGLIVLHLCKVGAFIAVGQAPLQSDAAIYWDDGQRILAGDWLLVRDPVEVSRTPGYLLFVAFFQAACGRALSPRRSSHSISCCWRTHCSRAGRVGCLPGRMLPCAPRKNATFAERKATSGPRYCSAWPCRCSAFPATEWRSICSAIRFFPFS